MSQTARRFFSADNLERAVLEAAAYYGLDPGRLRYEPVEKKHGFTKRRRVVIRVDPNNVELQPEEPTAVPGEVEGEVAAPDDEAAATADTAARADAAEPEAEAAGAEADAATTEAERAAEAGKAVENEPPAEAPSGPELALEPEAAAADELAEEETPAPTSAASEDGKQEQEVPGNRETSRPFRFPSSQEELIGRLPEPDPEVAAAAAGWLERLFDLADLDLEATCRADGEGLQVWLDGPDAEWLGDDEGEALAAVQALLPRLMQSDLGRVLPVRVECQGAVEYREERLRDQAHRAAAEVRRTGARAALEPMMPADRRIVHLALVHDATVETESVGRGFFKRVTVRPA